MKRRMQYIALGVGAALVIGAVAFRSLVAPALVRFPLNVDETAHYRGTAITYADPKTGAPLSQPLRQPLILDRRVQVLSGTATRAVVGETITMAFGTTRMAEHYQYVLDRRSMTLVDGPRQYAFGDPANPIHADGAFRVNWPMGTEAKPGYPSFVVQADAATPLTVVRGRHYFTTAGVSVIDFGTKVTHSVAPYYLAHLQQAGLPMQLSAAQVAAQLQAAGVDITKALADVGPLLTAPDRAALAATLAKPVPLNYFYVVDGGISIEPRTGMLINVHSEHEGLAVQPDLSGVSALRAMLDKYAGVPSVRAASDGLVKLAARPPSLVEELQYTQTDASVAHFGSKARDNIRRLNLVEEQLPWAAGALGLVLVLAGATLTLWRRPPRGDQRVTPPVHVPSPGERRAA